MPFANLSTLKNSRIKPSRFFFSRLWPVFASFIFLLRSKSSDLVGLTLMLAIVLLPELRAYPCQLVLGKLGKQVPACIKRFFYVAVLVAALLNESCLKVSCEFQNLPLPF